MANYQAYRQASTPGFRDMRQARGKSLMSRMHSDIGLGENINKVQAEIEAMNKQIKKTKGGNPLVSLLLGVINPALGAAYAGLSAGAGMKKKKGIAERFEQKMRKGYGKQVGGETIMGAGRLNPYLKTGMQQAEQYDYSGGDFLTEMMISA